MAMTDKSQGTRGISAFIVERDFPGFSIGKKEKKMGIRGSATCELIFENCIVPKENMLGKAGEGFRIAMKTLDGGRMGIASQALGIAQGAMDETVKYVKERKQFGRSIGQFQNTQFQLADLHDQDRSCPFVGADELPGRKTGKSLTLSIRHGLSYLLLKQRWK